MDDDGSNEGQMVTWLRGGWLAVWSCRLTCSKSLYAGPAMRTGRNLKYLNSRKMALLLLPARKVWAPQANQTFFLHVL